jgi:hypothetical protein
VGGGRAVFGWVLIAAAGSQLHDSLDTNVQGCQLLPDDALRHTPTQVLHQKPHTAVLWEIEGVETHTLPPIEGPQRTDHGSEPVGVCWYDHQILALELGRQTARARRP